MLESFSENLDKQCRAGCQKLTPKVLAHDKVSQIPPHATNLIVTFGLTAKKAIAENQQLQSSDSNYFYHVLLPRQPEHALRPRHAYLWLDQSPQAQLDILDRILDTDNKITVYFTEEEEWRLGDWQSISRPSSNNLDFRKIRPEQIGRELSRPEQSGQMVLMLPDKQLYNRYSLKQILLSGYLNQIGFIGYSRSLAKSGAALSIITDLDHYLLESAETTVSILMSGQMPGEAYSKHSHIILNPDIIDSLQLQLDTDSLDKEQVELISNE